MSTIYESRKINKDAKRLADFMIGFEENRLSEEKEVWVLQEIVKSGLVKEREIPVFWKIKVLQFEEKGLLS